MMLILHIIVALTSILVATALLFSPSKAKFFASYLTIFATLASGTIVVIQNGSHLLKACVSGLFYLAVVAVLVKAAYTKYYYAHNKS